MNQLVRRSLTALTALAICSCSLLSGAEDSECPGLNVPTFKAPPLINGELNDPCWKNAAAIDKFYIYRGEGKTTEAAKAFIGHDDAYLYIALDITLPHPEVIELMDLLPDGSIHNYDCAEIFIDPGADKDTYLHYQLGISNVRGERLCTNGGLSKDTLWNVPWRSATRVTDTGWQAEIALPLSVMAEYGKLDKLTMNIGVNRVINTLNQFGVVVSFRREVSSWAPVAKSFHEPGSFGGLKGLPDTAPKTPLLVAATGLRTGTYEIDENGNFFYRVEGQIQPYTDMSGTVRIMVEDKPGVGEPTSVHKDIDVDSVTGFQLNVPIKAFSDRTAELTLRDPETGEVLQLLRLRGMEGLSLMRSFVRYSYYTTEKNAEIVSELGLPDEELKNMKLVVKDASEKVLAREDKLSSKTSVQTPISKIKPGKDKHSWTVELQGANGNVMVSQKVAMTRREPRPGTEWKIDYDRGCLLNNGKPFFPFGVMSRITDGDGMKAAAADIADMGFNAVVRWSMAKDMDDLMQLPTAGKKHGFHIVEWIRNYSRLRPNGPMPENLPQGKEFGWQVSNVWEPVVKKLMNHPAVMSWYLWDEPPKTLEMAEKLKTVNNAVHETDGYHPTEVLFIPPFPEESEFSECMDIYGVDPYWAPGGRSDPNSVGRVVWQTRRRADRDMKLAIITPCAELYSGTRLRILSENEQRVQTYLALIQGAQGLLYFVYPFKHQSTYENFKRLGMEMKTLGPACADYAVQQNVSYSPVQFDPANNVFTDIQVSLKRNPDGGYILLAANWRPYPVEATYTIPLLESAGKVKAVFDKDVSWKVKEASFTDTFDAMDTRAYMIPGPAKLDTPVKISVDLKAFPKKTNKFYTRVSEPDGGIPGKRNVLHNPGFEDTSIPGMPDYYWNFRTTNIDQFGYRIGDTRGDPGVAIDEDNPFEGKHSLKIEGGLVFSFPKQFQKDTPYVFSFYARSDAKKGRISVAMQTGNKETLRCNLTPEWKRYSMKLVFPGTEDADWYSARKGPLFYIAGSGGPVWLDAMQLEAGTELTEYQEPGAEKADKRNEALFRIPAEGKPGQLADGLKYQGPSAFAFDNDNRPYFMHTFKERAIPSGNITTLRDGGVYPRVLIGSGDQGATWQIVKTEAFEQRFARM